jgi:4-hydroxybenzoate polyprenyltransferase
MNLPKFENLIDKIVKLNIDVFLVYLLINLFFLTKIWSEYGTLQIPESSLFILANTLILSATYLLNKVSDQEEDLLNQNQIHLNKNFTLSFYFLSFGFATIVYLLLNKEFIYFLIPLLFFSFFYSYPIKFKLKRIFLLKNILPAFSWYLTLILLIKLNVPELAYNKLFINSLALFVIFFIFEIFWDLPDRLGDRKVRVYTLPSVLGFRLSKMLLLVFLPALLIYTNSFPTKLLFLIMILFVANADETTPKKNYHLVVVFFALFFFLLSLINIFK